MTDTAVATPRTVKITTRCRCLGIGSTSHVERGAPNSFGDRPLQIASVGGPDVVGGLASIEREYARIKRIYSGGTRHKVELYVDGRRVSHWQGIGHALMELREFGATELEYLD